MLEKVNINQFLCSKIKCFYIKNIMKLDKWDELYPTKL